MRDDVAKADKIMERMGFSPVDTGRYVSELRAHVCDQVARGMVNRSGGSWAEDCYTYDENGFPVGYKISDEERARALLEVDWEIEHAHSRPVEPFFIDGGLIRRRFNARTMRTHYEVHYEMFWPWVRHALAGLSMRWRVFRDRHILRVRNPYSR